MVIGAMWFCGLSAVTANSRMLFAFARDGGAPMSSWLASVSAPLPHARRGDLGLRGDGVRCSPLWSRAYNVIVSISTIGLLRLVRACRSSWCCAPVRAAGSSRGPWNVGRWSPAVNTVAVVWIAFVSVLFVLPPNQLTGYTFAGALALLAVYYVAWARTHFEGPPALKRLGDAAIPTRTEAS